MFDYFWFWISKTLAEMAVGMTILLVLIVVVAVLAFLDKIKQWRCPHKAYRENRACHGICLGCKKDLGFVGELRKDKSKREM